MSNVTSPLRDEVGRGSSTTSEGVEVVGVGGSPATKRSESQEQLQLLEGDPQSSNGFIFVTQPLPSVSQFTEWVDQQHLPDAQTLMKGRRVKEDEVELFLDRASFIQDLVKTFCKNSRAKCDLPQPTSPSERIGEGNKNQNESTSGVSDGGGGGLEPTPNTPTGPSHELEEGVLAEDATESQSIASLENPRTWERVWKQFVLDLPRQNLCVQGQDKGRAIGADEAYQVITHFLQSLPDHVQDKISKFGLQPPPAASSKASWLTSLFSPFSLVAGQVAGHNQKENISVLTPEEKEKESEKMVLDGLQRLGRFICLLCQQSVLAVPFEIIATQYMQSSSPDTQLFVGEVNKNSCTDSGTMKISLNKTPQGSPSASSSSKEGSINTKEATRGAPASGDMPQLKIEKLFRVFALDEEEGDITLFHVASELLVDLLAPPDEPLVMKWRILDASKDEPKGKKKSTSDPTSVAASASSGASPPAMASPTRNCECLGSSSGFHKEECPKFKRMR